MCSIHWRGHLQILELTQGRDNTDAQILKMAKYQRISGLGLPRNIRVKDLGAGFNPKRQWPKNWRITGITVLYLACKEGT